MENIVSRGRAVYTKLISIHNKVEVLHKIYAQSGRRPCVLGHGQRTDARTPEADELLSGRPLAISGMIGIEAEKRL